MDCFVIKKKGGIWYSQKLHWHIGRSKGFPSLSPLRVTVVIVEKTNQIFVDPSTVLCLSYIYVLLLVDFTCMRINQLCFEVDLSVLVWISIAHYLWFFIQLYNETWPYKKKTCTPETQCTTSKVSVLSVFSWLQNILAHFIITIIKLFIYIMKNNIYTSNHSSTFTYIKII